LARNCCAKCCAKCRHPPPFLQRIRCLACLARRGLCCNNRRGTQRKGSIVLVILLCVSLRPLRLIKWRPRLNQVQLWKEHDNNSCRILGKSLLLRRLRFVQARRPHYGCVSSAACLVICSLPGRARIRAVDKLLSICCATSGTVPRIPSVSAPGEALGGFCSPGRRCTCPWLGVGVWPAAIGAFGTS